MERNWETLIIGFWTGYFACVLSFNNSVIVSLSSEPIILFCWSIFRIKYNDEWYTNRGQVLIYVPRIRVFFLHEPRRENAHHTSSKKEIPKRENTILFIWIYALHSEILVEKNIFKRLSQEPFEPFFGWHPNDFCKSTYMQQSSITTCKLLNGGRSFCLHSQKKHQLKDYYWILFALWLTYILHFSFSVRHSDMHHIRTMRWYEARPQSIIVLLRFSVPNSAEVDCDFYFVYLLIRSSVGSLMHLRKWLNWNDTHKYLLECMSPSIVVYRCIHRGNHQQDKRQINNLCFLACYRHATDENNGFNACFFLLPLLSCLLLFVVDFRLWLFVHFCSLTDLFVVGCILNDQRQPKTIKFEWWL